MPSDPLEFDSRTGIAKVGSAIVGFVGERVTDAGSASEYADRLYRIFASIDSGTALEIILRPIRIIPSPDQGAVFENIERAGRYVTTTDAASSSDVIDGIYWFRSIQDSSMSIDGMATTAFIISRDTSPGDDQVRTTKSIIIIDGLGSGDAILVHKSFRMVEPGYASDAIKALKGLLIPDAASAVEKVLSQRPLVLIVDTGAGTLDGIISQKPLVRILDVLSGGEMILTDRSFAVNDAGSVIEGLLADKLLFEDDDGVATDETRTPSRHIISRDGNGLTIEEVSRYLSDILRVDLNGRRRVSTLKASKVDGAGDGRVSVPSIAGEDGA